MTFTELHTMIISMGGNRAIVLDYATIKFERNTVTIESFLGETFTGLSKIRAIATLNRLEKEFNGV